MLERELKPFCTLCKSFIDRACFQRKEASANFSGKVESEERKKNTEQRIENGISSATIWCLRLQRMKFESLVLVN